MEAILVTVKGQGPFFTATLKTKSIKQPSNWPVSFSAPPPHLSHFTISLSSITQI